MSISSACSSSEKSVVSSQPLQNVSSLVPKLYQNVVSNGYGSPNTDVQLNTEFPKVPEQLVVYQITKVDDAHAYNIAKLFGLENNQLSSSTAGERNLYGYANDEVALEIYLNGSLHFYQRQSSVNSSVSLPSEDECTNIAREYLQSRGLYPQNVIRVKTGVCETIATVAKGSAPTKDVPVKMSVAFITSTNGYENYISGARVTIGDQGKVLELSCNDLELSEYGTVRLKTPDAAYSMLTDYIKDPSFNPIEGDQCMANWRGSERLNIDSISLQYTTPTNMFLLQPVYVFEGDAYLANQTTPEHFVGSVDAVQR
jgi:hypothetical protein